MAEVTAIRNNALPYPVYGVAFTVVFPMLDADGDLVTGASTPDAEVSKNGDTFADCTNESTEIATNSGIYYLTLTAAEMTADIVAVIAKSATAGMKTTSIVLYPRKLPILSTGTCQGSNDTGDIQLASGDSALDDNYNGCLCVAVIDGTTEARIINDYVGSTKVAEVSPAWNTAQPDSNDTYTIYLPEGRAVNGANVLGWMGTAPAAYSATRGTAGTALPAAAADAAGGLIISDAGGLDADAQLVTKINDILTDTGTTLQAELDGIQADTEDIQTRLPAALVSGRIDATIDGTGLEAAALALINAEVDTAIADAALATAANLATVAGYLDTEIAAILADTNELQTDWVDGGRLDLLVDAIKAKTDNLPSDPADASVIAGRFDDVDSFLTTIDGNTSGYLPGLVPIFGVIGTTGNDTTHVHLPDPGFTYADDAINGMLLTILDLSAGLYYSRWIEDWSNTGNLATVATLPFTPEASTDKFWLLAMRADVTGGSGLDAAGVRAAVGLASANLDTQLAAIDDAVDTEVAAIVSAVAAVQADTDDIQTRLPAALVSGRMDSSVGAMAANVMTAAAAAADLATELQSGLATAAALTSAASDITAIKAKTDNLPSDPADQSLIIAATNALSSEIAAVQADTDDIQTRLPAALVSGRMDASVGAMAANVMTAAAAAADLTTELQSGLATQASVDDLPTNAELATALGTADDAVLAQVALVKAKTDLIPATPASTTNITAASGVSLAATGLDAITATAPATVASTFPQMVVQLWRRFFKKTVHDTGATTIKTYADNGSTVVTTQSATSSGGVDTVDAAT